METIQLQDEDEHGNELMQSDVPLHGTVHDDLLFVGEWRLDSVCVLYDIEKCKLVGPLFAWDGKGIILGADELDHGYLKAIYGKFISYGNELLILGQYDDCAGGEGYCIGRYEEQNRRVVLIGNPQSPRSTIDDCVVDASGSSMYCVGNFDHINSVHASGVVTRSGNRWSPIAINGIKLPPKSHS